MPCSGAAAEACGGPARLTLLGSGAAPPAAPVTNPGVGDWLSLGCYS